MFSKSLSLAAVLAAIATFAQADGLPKWETVGDWEIVIDEKAGNGCIMQKVFDDGVLLQFGLLPLRDGGFFAAYSQDWTGIEAGAKGPVAFQFDGIEFTGDSEGYVAAPWFGGFAFTNNPSLVYDFAKKETMTVSGPRGGALTLSLDGTLKGVEELIACQVAQVK